MSDYKIDDERMLEIIEKDNDLFQMENQMSQVQNRMKILEAGRKCIDAYKRGNKVIVAGNGGSAADAQHISAEFTGYFDDRERRALNAIALHCDTSAVTAISNDLGYELVFSRLIEAYGNEGDVFIAITTSGNSPNILRAIEEAKKRKLYTIVLLGGDGGKAKDIADLSLVACSSYTPSIQGIHSRFYHPICKIVDLEFSEKAEKGIEKIMKRL